MKIVMVRFLLFSILVQYIAFAQPGVTRVTYDEVQSKVDAVFGKIYEVYAINSVDSGFVGSTVQNAAMEDPFGTLKSCFVFAAVGKEREDEYTYKGFVGVYKNNQIVWRSDTVINDDVARFVSIAATMDLSNDGTVEIVSNWSQDSRGGPDYLWIFSWDGTTGTLINEVDEFGYSLITSVGGGLIEFVDVNGDGVMEIKGFWSDDVNVGDLESPVIYSWNGQMYGKWPTAPRPLPSGYLPRNKLSATIRANAIRVQGKLEYRYLLQNAVTSSQKIDELLLINRSNLVTNGLGRTKWRFALLKRSLMGWTNLFIQPNSIAQGETDSSFRYESGGLPYISSYYVRGHNPTLRAPSYDEETSFRDKVENSVRGFTLGPSDPPDPFIPVAFLDTLISYKHQAFSLGWIKNQGLVTSFDQKLENAKQQVERGNTQSAKNILEAFVNEIEALNKQENQITSEAYALLKFNAEYLISKL